MKHIANGHYKRQKNKQKMPKWIPFSERKPTKEDANSEGKILVWWATDVLSCTDTQYVDSDIIINNNGRLSHWTHLPDPPKGAQRK